METIDKQINIKDNSINSSSNSNSFTNEESPTSSSSDSSSVSSTIYEPIVKEINDFTTPPLQISTESSNNVEVTTATTIEQYNNSKEEVENEEKGKEKEEINNNNINNVNKTTTTTNNIESTTTPTTSPTKPPVSPTIIALSRSSPYYNSKAPDIRDQVNGFPIKLHHMKTKEFLWLQHIQTYTHDNVITSEINKLIRVGLPKRIRGYVWRFFSGAIELERKNIGVYQHFLAKSSDEYEYKISKDISRTFPNNPDFNSEQGQNSLFRILKAYSIMDPEIGYTQGMSFIAAVLLSEMDETESFWTFTSIMKNYKLSTLFCDDLSLLRQYLYVIDRLIETTNPKLFSHLKEIGVTPVLFASEWISTLFTYNFELAISKRLLDVFFIEGRFYLHRMSLAILKIYEKQLISCEFEEAVEFLKKLGSQVDPDLLLKISDSLPLSIEMIEGFEDEFLHPEHGPSDYF